MKFSGSPVAKSPLKKEDDLSSETTPPPIRITLASLEEYNHLIQNGLDFYGATFFPTEPTLPQLSNAKIATKRGRYDEIQSQ